MNRHEIIAIAQSAQRRVISSSMIEHYVGGGRKIAKWGDFKFSLVSFLTTDIDSDYSTGTVRRNLDKLAAAGDLERRKDYRGSMIRYRFPRPICDSYAAEAIAHYQAIGYSQDEIRPEVKP